MTAHHARVTALAAVLVAIGALGPGTRLHAQQPLAEPRPQPSGLRSRRPAETGQTESVTYPSWSHKGRPILTRRVAKRPKTYPPPPPEAKALGRRMRALRDDRGWTQEELADAAELDRAYVAGMEVGLRNPSLRNLAKVARALRVPLASLFESG